MIEAVIFDLDGTLVQTERVKAISDARSMAFSARSNRWTRVLGVTTEDIPVIEDSVSGVQAALSAGMKVLAVSTPFIRQSLHEANLLPGSLIIDDPGQVVEVATSIMK